MADAELQLRLRADSNLPEVLSADERALQNQRRAREKAERDLARIIERGDPLKALERRQQRELQQLEKFAQQQLISAERLEQARTQILERHVAQRIALEERQAQAAQRLQQQAAAVQAAELNKLKTRITDVRSAVGALSGASAGLFGQWSAGAASILGAFASGGAVALAISGITAGISALTARIREQREETRRLEEEALKAARKAAQDLEDRIRRAEQAAQRRRDAAVGVDRELADTQVLLVELTTQVAEKQAELTAAQTRLVEEGQRLAAARVAAQGIETERTRQLEQSVQAAQAEVRRLADEYQVLQARIQRTAGAIHDMGEAARGTDAPGAGAAVASPQAGERYGAELARLQSEADEIQALMEVGLHESRETIQRYASEAAKDLADYLRAADPFVALDREVSSQVETIEARIRELQVMARDPALRAEAVAAIEDLERQLTAVHERYVRERQDLELKAIEIENKAAIASIKERRAQAGKMDPKEAERWEAFGWQAGASMMAGMARYMESDDPLDLVRTFFAIAGGVANIFLPGSGSLISAIGGFFERGGAPYAFHIPQGRQGLALGPGPSHDAKPAWLHPREVVMPADVVERDFGGLPEAMAVASGRGLPARGAGTVVQRVEIRAFDSQDALRGLRRSLAPAQVERRSARQGALEASSLASWGNAPRYA